MSDPVLRWVFAEGLAYVLADDAEDPATFIAPCGLTVPATVPVYGVAPSRWRRLSTRTGGGNKIMTTEGKTDAPGRFTISKSFDFSASHELWLLPETHKCRRNHGHNYVVTLTLTADRLNEYGFVTDFDELTPFDDYLKTTFDHRRLNDQVGFHPTCELLAEHLGRWFIDNVEADLHGRLVSVQVSETPLSSARWERGDSL